MAPRFAPSPLLRGCCLAATFALLGALGCHKKETSGALYVYDGNSGSVLAWNDVDKVYSAASGAVPAADRTITSASDLFTGMTLAWGGLTVDSNTDTLYLVSNSGTVYAIYHVSTQNGALSNLSDINSFTLGGTTDTGEYANASYGQASADESQNALYVMETQDQTTPVPAGRIWKVIGASGITASPILLSANCTFSFANDTYGTGVAGTNHQVYGLFGGGSQIYQNSSTTLGVGPRLRQGTSLSGANGVFPTSLLGTQYGTNLLTGGNTQLNTATYGALGYDASNQVVYALAGPSPTAILKFNQSLFSNSAILDSAPSATLADSTAAPLASLRTISHPLNSDWLLGATFTPATNTTGPEGTGTGTLYIWKSPSGGGTPNLVTLPNVQEIRGMAISDN